MSHSYVSCHVVVVNHYKGCLECSGSRVNDVTRVSAALGGLGGGGDNYSHSQPFVRLAPRYADARSGATTARRDIKCGASCANDVALISRTAAIIPPSVFVMPAVSREQNRVLVACQRLQLRHHQYRVDLGFWLRRYQFTLPSWGRLRRKLNGSRDHSCGAATISNGLVSGLHRFAEYGAKAYPLHAFAFGKRRMHGTMRTPECKDQKCDDN